jgi:hypothetical protein
MIKPHRERAALLRDFYRARLGHMMVGWRSHEEHEALRTKKPYRSRVLPAFGWSNPVEGGVNIKGQQPGAYYGRVDGHDPDPADYGYSDGSDYGETEIKGLTESEVTGGSKTKGVVAMKPGTANAASTAEANRNAQAAYNALSDIPLPDDHENLTWYDHIYKTVYHLSTSDAMKLALEAVALARGGDSVVAALTVAYYMYFGSVNHEKIGLDQARQMSHAVLSPDSAQTIPSVNTSPHAPDQENITYWDVLESELGPAIYLVANQFVAKVGQLVGAENIFIALNGGATLVNDQIAISPDYLGGRLAHIANYFLRYVFPQWSLEYTPLVGTTTGGQFAIGQVESGDFLATNLAPTMTFINTLQMEDAKASAPYQKASIATENQTTEWLFCEDNNGGAASSAVAGRQSIQNSVAGANLDDSPASSFDWGTLVGTFHTVFSQLSPDLGIATLSRRTLRVSFGPDARAFIEALLDPRNADKVYQLARDLGVDCTSRPAPKAYRDFAYMARIGGMPVKTWPQLSGYSRFLMEGDASSFDQHCSKVSEKPPPWSGRK